MTRLSDFDADHALRTYRGMVNPRRAAPMLPRISDGVNEVPNASELLFTGGTVTEPEDGVAQITIGGGAGGGSGTGSSGGNGTSSANSVLMLNNSGQDLLPGDVVVTDETADNAVTITTTAGDTRIAGVVVEPIADGMFGKVLFGGSGGYVAFVNAPDAVRGEYVQTSTTATQADSTSDREPGSFGVYLTGTDFPSFAQDAVTTTAETPVETLTIDLPVAPVDRELFLALWLVDGVTGVDIPDWTLIGAEAGLNYYYRVTTGDDAPVATWTGLSVAVATVLLLDPSVSLVNPIEDHDYEDTTAAASLSGLSDAARYAIAGVKADVTTPGSGFTRIAGGTAGFVAGGTPALVQSKKVGDDTNLTFDSTVTVGNLIVAVPTANSGMDVSTCDSRDTGGSCPIDSRMTQIARNVNTGPTNGYAAISIVAKTTDDTYSGSFYNSARCSSTQDTLFMMEFENVGVVDYEVLSTSGGYDTPVDLGDFTVGANDLVVMAIIFRGTVGPDPLIGPNGFTEMVDEAGFAMWWWVGYKIGDGDCSVTLSNGGGQYWGAAAVKFSNGSQSVAGTLAGKYIGHDAAVTSPFTGAGKEDDAIFAVNLVTDAKPAALLYGPDLGAGGSTSIVDAGGYFTGANVEDVLQELASKDIGYQSHGSMGATETFSALTGWHSGTLNADCTFTFSGATSGLVASMVLELTEDGTGGWQPTWPGSVVWPGGSAPTHDDTAGSTTLYLFESRDGGTTWYGFQAGGGTSITFGTPGIVLGTAAAAGSIDEVIRRDATIVAFDATVPTTSAEGDSAATGSAAVAARRDHKHGREAFGTTAQAIGTSAGGSATTPSKSDHVHATGASTPSTQAIGDAAATGTGPAASMTDHKHAMPSFGSPVDVGTANADGSAATIARSDHVHAGATGAGSHAHIVSETHLSDGSTTTYTLDENFEPGSVAAWNTTTLARLGVTETAPDQATVSAAGSSGDSIIFDYAATIA